jgi:mono/diheme cytochrome c family protein
VNSKTARNMAILAMLFLGLLTIAAACGPAAQATPPMMSPTTTLVGETPIAGTSLPATPEPAVGRQIWAEKGCSGCHGAEAQGNVGPRLAGTGLTFDQVLLVVRTGKGVMPAYSQSSISDLEVRHVYAWLRSLPEATGT